MLEFCLITMLWNIDSTVLNGPTTHSLNAVATCIRPAGHVALPATAGNLLPPERLPAAEPKDWLDRWEQTSSEMSWSRSRREEFRRTIQSEFNEHTAVAAEGFIGKIDARRLLENYDWAIAEEIEEELILEAIPRDEMERLFLRSFHVRLSTTDGSPQQLWVTGRNQPRQTIWTVESPANRHEIQLIQFEDVPPLPATVSRTGDASVH